MDTLVVNVLPQNHLVKFGIKTSELRINNPPNYFISKQEIELSSEIKADDILNKIASKFRDMGVNTIDGLKINWIDKLAHLQKSKNEPIITIYTEASTEKEAFNLSQQLIDIIKGITN